MGEEIFPKMVTDVPEIDISLEGVRGWLLQGTERR